MKVDPYFSFHFLVRKNHFKLISDMLKISALLRKDLLRTTSANFGILNSDNLSRDSQVRLSHISEYPVQKIYGS